MTCGEKFILEHPGESVLGRCPADYGYFPKPENCNDLVCIRDCWMREVLKEPSSSQK